MMKILHKAVLLLTVLWSVALLPEQAFAQTASLVCNSGGGVQSGEFFYTAPNTPGSACEFTALPTHIFSAIICQFVTLLNSVLGSVYCGMQALLLTMVGAVLTIFVAVFGAQMLMGSVNLSAREFLTRLFKMVFVWIFISQSVWAVQYAFNFFVLVAGEGVDWVMSAIPNPWPLYGPPPQCYDIDAAAASGFMAAFTRLDVIVCNAVTGQMATDNSPLIGFLLVLSFLAPPIGFLVLSWLLLTLKIIVHGLVTFLLGIAGIAFLIALSPIFLSMMLFKATASFFENWLKFMISFSLQIIVVFAVAALWLLVMLHFINFFDGLSATIFANQNIHGESALQTTNDSWGVCGFLYYPDSTTASPPPPPGTPPGPYVRCDTARSDIIPISSLIWPAASQDLIGPPSPHSYINYLYYIIYHLITLIIVSFAFDALLREAPMIAVYLAGPDYVSPLAPGMAVNRAGQVRQLFSSSASSPGGGSSANASSEGGFSLRKMLTDPFRSQTTSPPGGRSAGIRAGGAPQTASVAGGSPPAASLRNAPSVATTTIARRAREQASSMVTKRPGNDVT